MRFAAMLGTVSATAIAACGLELGGTPADLEAGLPDGNVDDALDAPMDVMTPDLGTGETESGAQCTCTPPLPNGWQFVAYDPMTRPSCPSSYGSPTDTHENPTAAATQCACNCSGLATQPTCTADASFAYGFGSGSMTCNTFTGNITCGSVCRTTNVSHSGNANDLSYLSVNGTVTPSGGSCNAASPSVTTPAPTSQQGRVCALQDTPGVCGQGACVPTPSQGYAVCIAKAGMDACPQDFPNAHVVGDAIGDTRSCGPNACTCALSMGTCSAPQVRLWWGSTTCGNNEWSGGPRTANGTCVATGYGGAGGNIQSCRYTSTNSGAACTFTGSFMPQGGLGVTNAKMICCL